MQKRELLRVPPRKSSTRESPAGETLPEAPLHSTPGTIELAPTSRTGTTTRKHIQERLLSASAFAVTLVIAPAGFGKTTAVQHFIHGLPGSTLIRVPGNSSLQKFAHEFARSLSLPYADVVLLDDDNTQNIQDNSIELYAAWALRHLGDITCTIAIDDLQNANGDDRVSAFLIRLADATKDHVKWIFIARTAGRLPVTRWLAYGDSDSIITADDLLMTLDDAETLAKSQNSPATSADLERWISQTNGYIIPLAYAIRLSAQRRTISGIMDGSRKITFNFLAEEFWSTVAPSDRDLLEVAAFLPPLHLHAFEKAGIAGSTPAIARLSDDIAFLTLNGSGTFSMHDVFRDFVKQQVLLAGPGAQLSRQKSAINILFSNEHIDDAFRILADIKDTALLIYFAKQYSAEIVDPSVISDVFSAIKNTPTSDIPTCLLSLKIDVLSWQGASEQPLILAKEILGRSDSTSSELLCAIRATYRAIKMQPMTEQSLWQSRAPEIIGKLNGEDSLQAKAYQAQTFAIEIETKNEARALLQEISLSLKPLSLLARIKTQSIIATAYFYLEDRKSALRSAREALALAETTADIRERARTLNSLGTILLSEYDAEVEHIFEPLRDAVEQTGAWRFSEASHWLPGLYFAWKGDAEAARFGRALQESIIISDDFHRARLSALRRHSANLGNLLENNTRTIISDFTREELPSTKDGAYVLLTDVAIAYILQSDYASSENALHKAQKVRETLSPVAFRGCRSSAFLEIIALGAQGRWAAARRLKDRISDGAPSLIQFERVLERFCDGPPFTGLAILLENCRGKPYVGLAAELTTRLIEKIGIHEAATPLTGAENDVLKLLCIGKSNKEIATIRSRSAETVKRQVAAIYKKLNVDNRTAAAASARERGMI